MRDRPARLQGQHLHTCGYFFALTALLRGYPAPAQYGQGHGACDSTELFRAVVITSEVHCPLRNSLDLKSREKPESWRTSSRAHRLMWKFMQVTPLCSAADPGAVMKARDHLLSLVATCILHWLSPAWLAIRDSKDTLEDGKHTKS